MSDAFDPDLLRWGDEDLWAWGDDVWHEPALRRRAERSMVRSMAKRLEVGLLYGSNGVSGEDPTLWPWFDEYLRRYDLTTLAGALKERYAERLADFVPPNPLLKEMTMTKAKKRVAARAADAHEKHVEAHRTLYAAATPRELTAEERIDEYKRRTAELERECATLRTRASALETALAIVAKNATATRGDY